MSWKRRQWARTSEALRATTTLMYGEPIIPTDGPNAKRLFIGDGVTPGGRAVRFMDDAIPIAPAVRQTVSCGPVAAGLPTFLPATAGFLTLGAQGVSASAPLVVTAATGFGAQGQQNVSYAFTANPVWTSLAASATNYLYVNAATGATGSTAAAPVYQYGGTLSIAAGQFTFDTQAMVGYLGNGTAAVPTPLVFVGEAVTSGTTVTGTVPYAYNGLYDSGWTTGLTTTSPPLKSHNLGVVPEDQRYILRNLTADLGYSPGQTIVGGASAANSNYGPIASWATRLLIGLPVVSNQLLTNQVSGVVQGMTFSSWAYKLVAARGFGGS